MRDMSIRPEGTAGITKLLIFGNGIYYPELVIAVINNNNISGHHQAVSQIKQNNHVITIK